MPPPPSFSVDPSFSHRFIASNGPDASHAEIVQDVLLTSPRSGIQGPSDRISCRKVSLEKRSIDSSGKESPRFDEEKPRSFSLADQSVLFASRGIERSCLPQEASLGEFFAPVGVEKTAGLGQEQEPLLGSASDSSSCEGEEPLPVIEQEKRAADTRFTLRHHLLSLAPVLRHIVWACEMLIAFVTTPVVEPIRGLLHLGRSSEEKYEWFAGVKTAWRMYTHRNERLFQELREGKCHTQEEILTTIDELASHRKDYLKVQFLASILGLSLLFLFPPAGLACLGVAALAGVLKMSYDPAAYVHYFVHTLELLNGTLGALKEVGEKEEEAALVQEMDPDVSPQEINEQLQVIQKSALAFYQKRERLRKVEREQSFFQRFFNGRHRFNRIEHEVIGREDEVSSSSLNKRAVALQRYAQSLGGGGCGALNSAASGTSQIMNFMGAAETVVSKLGPLSLLLSPLFVLLQLPKKYTTDQRIAVQFFELSAKIDWFQKNKANASSFTARELPLWQRLDAILKERELDPQKTLASRG